MGDALLELVASCLRTHKRAADVAARLGGDEFALLLPDADLETAFAVADRIRGAITAETLGAFRPSASFGVATFPLHGRTSADLMKTADEALYRAKQRGGDDIFAFSE
jgi:diguanylate cyclase (GGDEF)-like protein